MGNSFGHLFRITTWGESHGGGVGVVIDGCPPRLELAEADIQKELDRRRPGQSKVTTPRQEADRCEILSGVFEGRTLGTPGYLADNLTALRKQFGITALWVTHDPAEAAAAGDRVAAMEAGRIVQIGR